jgi:hypothetical protein
MYAILQTKLYTMNSQEYPFNQTLRRKNTSITNNTVINYNSVTLQNVC